TNLPLTLLQLICAQSQSNSSGSPEFSLVNQYRIVNEVSGTALVPVLTIWYSAYSVLSGLSLSCERSCTFTGPVTAGVTAAWAPAGTKPMANSVSSRPVPSQASLL